MKVSPSKDIEQKYRVRLIRLLRTMNKAVLVTLQKLYKKNESSIVLDKSPADTFEKTLKKLMNSYKSIFEKHSEKLAEDMVNETNSFVTKRLEKDINSYKKKLDPKAKRFMFTGTPKSVIDIKSAFIKENVSLIKSIPDQYFKDIETDVFLSLAKGNDLSDFSDVLEKNYGIARNRAVIIARDQTNKATSFLGLKRAESVGIKRAEWIHSGGGKTPRQSHVMANGKIFLISEGLKVDGKFIIPGEEINCRCESRPILDFLEEEA